MALAIARRVDCSAGSGSSVTRGRSAELQGSKRWFERPVCLAAGWPAPSRLVKPQMARAPGALCLLAHLQPCCSVRSMNEPAAASSSAPPRNPTTLKIKFLCAAFQLASIHSPTRPPDQPLQLSTFSSPHSTPRPDRRSHSQTWHRLVPRFIHRRPPRRGTGMVPSRPESDTALRIRPSR